MTTAKLTAKQSLALPSVSVLKAQLNNTIITLAIPVLGIAVFLLTWSAAANRVDTLLAKFPKLAAYQQFSALYGEHVIQRSKAAAFYQRPEARYAEPLAQNPTYQPNIYRYTGKETFLDQTISTDTKSQ